MRSKMLIKFDKFRLLMWKNWVIQLRHPWQTVFEILGPVLVCFILVIVRGLANTEYQPEQHFLPDNLEEIEAVRLNFTVVYSPKLPYLEKIVLNATHPNKNATGLDNAQDVEDFLMKVPGNEKVGIVFDDDLPEDGFPDNIRVTLRYAAEMGDWTTDHVFAPINPPFTHSGFYILEYFLMRAITNIGYKNHIESYVLMQRFPQPATYTDPLMMIIGSLISFLITTAFNYTAISIIKVITVEKELQLKESMKIMGLSTGLHWTAWFAKSFIFMFFTILLMTILFKVDFYADESIPAVFPRTNPVLMFIFLILYASSMITLCFLISVFFTKANLASSVGGVLYFFTFVPFMIMQARYDELSLTEKLLASLLSSTAMGFGFNTITLFEDIGAGLQWDNLFKKVNADDNITMAHILLMLIVDTILYMLLTLYIEAVFPGKYGVPKKWNFVFMALFKKRKVEESYHSRRQSIDHDNFEEEPNLPPGIEIRHLHKKFGKKVAVEDLSLKMYHNQITALLGHNGAGKTTTLSMLTGMFPPSSGTAIINGYDICTNIQGVRQSLGLCPQHNVLFDELTVEEHIFFFCRLKGMERKEIKGEIKHYLKLLDLTDKLKTQSAHLSGGMKRKLSVANAFCGGAKVVMLDEPTAGMDPYARRKLWEFIEAAKAGKTILLTTHFMDEADLLGDRIAIMSGGKLQCCGSSFFLKKRYGAGYHLIFEKTPQCNIDGVTTLLKKYIPNIEVEHNIGSELSYLLPEDKSDVFEKMLKDIEDSSNKLGIRSYGISLSTLEEVFLKVGKDTEQEERNAKKRKNDDQGSITGSQTEINVNIEETHNITGFALKKNHVYAMLLKRFYITKRSWPYLLLQQLIPIFLVMVSMMTVSNSAIKDYPPLEYSLDHYDSPVTLLENIDCDNITKGAEAWLDDHNYDYETVKNFTEEILFRAEVDPAKVFNSYIVGATIFYSVHTRSHKPVFLVWYNLHATHSRPTAVSFAMNALLKVKNPSADITIVNHPLPYTLETKIRQHENTGGLGFALAFNISFCMVIITSLYVLFYIRERICKAKHIQILSGVSLIIFWGVSFFWDWVTYLITVICLIVTLAIHQEEGYAEVDELGRVTVLLLVFGLSMLPLVYLISFRFDLPSTGFTRLTLLTMLVGTIAFMVIEILSFEPLDLMDIANTLDSIFIFVPHYSLPKGLKNLYNEKFRVKRCKLYLEMPKGHGPFAENFLGIEYNSLAHAMLCEKIPECCDLTEHYFVWGRKGINRIILVSILVGVGAFAYLLLKEYRIIEACEMKLPRVFRSKMPKINEDELDDDVLEERKRVLNLSKDEIREHTLVLRDLTKYYKKFLAVNRVCLGIKQYECFGLLGVNGAGKTSTFQMITGDSTISHGDVFLNGHNLVTNFKDCNKSMGYCPQFDALFDDITARETLKLFALLHGVHLKDCRALGEKMAEDFDFYRHIDKQVKQLSGGNKRKLSCAIALIGNPSIVYLDEPTAGMDPGTRRFLWNVLCQLRDSGKCLVLTSHSMEECEALCTRLAIMVKGQFKCIGSTQHLKSKFTDGFTASLKLKKSNTDDDGSAAIIEYFQTNFPDSELREKHQELMTFFIPRNNYKWSDMFGILEAAKTKLNIEDYSVGQSSLEAVFLSFTKQQEEE